MVTSALDALCQLLRAPPSELLAALLTEGALERSRLQPDAAPAASKANSQWRDRGGLRECGGESWARLLLQRLEFRCGLRFQ